MKMICQSTKDERWRNQCWEGITYGQNMSEAPISTGTVGLPPNVVFEPKDSEPFTKCLHHRVSKFKPPEEGCRQS